ncbi:MAG TPA: rRNA maturation RNase YbeY [Methyloceanibacter sp.]|nr:rRNA maturation RNase YbeY [Methyloceanibacter sp.]
MAEGGPSRTRADASGVTLGVEVVRHDEAWANAKIGDAELQRAARAGFAAASPQSRGNYEVALVLTDDAEVRALNRTWRGKDTATNVLSFPADADVSEPGYIGDVVLAFGTVQKETREQDISLQDHVAHLVVHGVLHLLGLDHADDAEAERMEDLERKALASLGIADPYGEREAHPSEVSP